MQTKAAINQMKNTGKPGEKILVTRIVDKSSTFREYKSPINVLSEKGKITLVRNKMSKKYGKVIYGLR